METGHDDDDHGAAGNDDNDNDNNDIDNFVDDDEFTKDDLAKFLKAADAADIENLKALVALIELEPAAPQGLLAGLVVDPPRADATEGVERDVDTIMAHVPAAPAAAAPAAAAEAEVLTSCGESDWEVPLEPTPRKTTAA